MHNLNQPVVNAFSATTLTAAYTGNRKAIETGGFSQISLDVTYAMGATETANTLELQLEASYNGTNWHALTHATAAATSVLSAKEFQMSEGSLNILQDIAYKYIRLSLKETGVVTNFGSATVNITLSGLS